LAYNPSKRIAAQGVDVVDEGRSVIESEPNLRDGRRGHGRTVGGWIDHLAVSETRRSEEEVTNVEIQRRIRKGGRRRAWTKRGDSCLYGKLALSRSVAKGRDGTKEKVRFAQIKVFVNQ